MRVRANCADHATWQSIPGHSAQCLGSSNFELRLRCSIIFIRDSGLRPLAATEAHLERNPPIASAYISDST